jgi:hypothetical protein
MQQVNAGIAANRWISDATLPGFNLTRRSGNVRRRPYTGEASDESLTIPS